MLGLDNDDAKDSSSQSISQVALSVLSRMTSSLFWNLGTSLFSGYTCTSKVEDAQDKLHEEAVELCNLNLDAQFHVVENAEMHDKTTAPEIKQASDDLTLPSGSNNSDSFRQFDMVNDCSDHHFFNESGMNLQSPQVRYKNLL